MTPAHGLLCAAFAQTQQADLLDRHATDIVSAYVAGAAR